MGSTFDWHTLKAEYKTGTIKSVRAFLRNKGIKMSGNVSRKVTGWRVERESYQRTYQKQVEVVARDRMVDSFVDDIAKVRTRHAKIARNLQAKGIKGLMESEPRTAMESLRMFLEGARLEREALGINDNQAELYDEPGFMKTRYAQKLKHMNYGELQEVLRRLDKLDKKGR